MKGTLFLIVILFSTFIGFSGGNSINAQSPTGGWSSDPNCSVDGGVAGVDCYIASPPSLSGSGIMGMIEANGFENVFTYGDVLVIMRYRLPIKDLPLLNNPANAPVSWGSTYCDFLEDNTNCHIVPPAPTFAQSIAMAGGITTVGARVSDYGKPSIKYGYCRDTRTGLSWDDCWDTTTSDVLFSFNPSIFLPRVGYGLVSLYAETQNSVSILFGDQTGIGSIITSGGRVCVYPNKDVWASVSSSSGSCQTVNWHSEQNSPSSSSDPLVHDKFREVVLDQVKELENDLNLGNNVITTPNDKITVLGSTYVGEGIPRANEVLSPIYEIGTQKAITEAHITSSALPLQNTIDTNYANTELKTTFDTVSQFYMGFQDSNTGLYVIIMLIFIIAIGFAFGYVKGYGSGGGRMVFVIGTTPLFVFLFVGFPSVGFIFTMVAILSVFGTYFIFSRSA